jgi:glycosyltransferase involved in cell wall biosynthesis
MKIAFYANEIAQSGKSGVKTYSLEIIKSLLRIDGKNSYTLYSQKDISREISSDRANFAVLKPKKKFWAFSVFARKVKEDRPDVVFMPIQIFPFFGKNKPKTVIIIHDVAFLLFPDHFTFLKRKLLEFHTKRSVELADKIIVPSEATKRDILRFYRVKADKIMVIYHGYSENLVKIANNREEDVKMLTKNSPYILFVGSIQPRKNILRLVEAFEEIKKSGKTVDLKLIICGGRGWMYEGIYVGIKKSLFSGDIFVISDADDELLACLYKNAQVFVLPSLYEGFGLPVLEAMSFGLPVVCGNNSSLAEIVGNAGLLVDAYDYKDIADKLKMLLISQELKAELSGRSFERSKAFSWEKAAKETLEVLEEVF